MSANSYKIRAFLTIFCEIVCKSQNSVYLCNVKRAQRHLTPKAQRAPSKMKVLTAAYRTDAENDFNFAAPNTTNEELNQAITALRNERENKLSELVAARPEGTSIRRSQSTQKMSQAGFGYADGGFYTPSGKIVLSDVKEWSGYDGMSPVVGTYGTVTVTLY